MLLAIRFVSVDQKHIEQNSSGNKWCARSPYAAIALERTNRRAASQNDNDRLHVHIVYTIKRQAYQFNDGWSVSGKGEDALANFEI